MKKLTIGALLVAMAVVMAAPAQAAFTVGGENGWALSTDGIVNIFGIYATTEANKAGGFSLLNLSNSEDQKFGVRVGLLPSIIALNVKAPTVGGVESNVRVAFYPNVQNNNGDNQRFETAPNIDNREFFYTATGKYGQLLAGRALNLFQGQNILNDMTLFTAGVADMSVVRGGTSLGHIGYGYLYTNFGPQFRYTTPDMGGVKVALEVGEPYAISDQSGKQDIPRLEAEVSYAGKFGNTSVHAWLEGLWQQDTRNNIGPSITPAHFVFDPTTGGSIAVPDTVNPGTARRGGHNTSLGIAPGVNVQIGAVGLMGSGYYGQGLGMYSAQDGPALGHSSVASDGKERNQWGFLAQATYQLTDAIRLAANYGRTDNCANDHDPDYVGLMKTHEAVVGQVNWNLNKFTQFTFEYIYARDSWFGTNHDMSSNQFALGTVFFW